MSNSYKISLGVQLNTKGLSSQIKSINSKTPVEVSLKLDVKNAQAQIDSIRQQIQSLGNIRINLGGTGTGVRTRTGSTNTTSQVNEANWAYRQMLDIQKRANSLSLKMNGLDTSKNVNELRELSLQFARLRSDYETLRATFGGQLSTTQWGNLQAELTETEAKLSAMDAKIADTKAKLANSIQSNFGTYDTDIASVESKFSSLSNKSTELRTRIDALKQALAEMKTAYASGDIDRVISSNEIYKQTLKDVEAQLKRNKIAEQDANNVDKLNASKEKLSLQMSNWLKNNSAAAKQFGGEIQNLQTQLRNCSNMTEVGNVGRAFDNVKLKAQEAGVATQTFGDKIKTAFSKYAAYFSAFTVFMYATRAMKDMFNQVKSIDSAMTELKKVTNETNESYNQFLENASARAQEIGTTIDGLVSSTADFARLGYNFKDSQGLAEVANIYAVVGDEVEGVEGATESLISTMAAFKDEAVDASNTDFATSIIDKFNEIGKLIA